MTPEVCTVTPEQLWAAADAVSLRRGHVEKLTPWRNLHPHPRVWWEEMAEELNRALADSAPKEGA